MKLGILWRDAGWHRLLFSAVVLAGAGGLAAFMLVFLAFVPFDRFYYTVGMSYQSRVVSDAPLSGRSLHVGAEVNVSPSLPENADGMYLQSRTVSLIQPLDSESFEKTLASTLTGGTISDNGVVMDEASLAAWGIGIGDKVVLQGGDFVDPCLVAVTGSTRPVNTAGGAIGQVVAPERVCSEQLSSIFAASPGHWVTYDHPGSTGPGNWADAFSALGAEVSFTALAWVVSLLSGGLWVLVLWRTAAQLSSRTARSALSLVWIGASPKQLAHAAQVILFALAVFGSVGAVLVAKETLMVSTRFYAQPALVLVVGIGMAAMSLLVAGLYYRGWPVSIRSSLQKGEL
ncbi:hypothetical protein [Propionicimonas sp.]|uniref:hypothetical protein n=1 Tax=Propionicimonas sp. TaxID=1955623 RepID=UPI0017A35187|nr:hypothetical protein [Propionicimonas sp.]MBU3975428.1 hypothetical protein [Actinomycetota bacterium]MBA3020166.1 hypothetical protein [Propionicimonas sp.]MBU3986423.1 hypothetical protein [Actinomycetota bacterium]MBU4007992.1 hypothetical protein [Actinomycetota bacterium]MBU4064250.1 hypothetical protein [Actinomycetota bacterium]